jgi:ABC-2 type transport system ATP-binding protein
MKPILEIHALRKRFRRVVAVDDLTLAAPEGAVTAFLGPNGAGKTTTIKCLLNLLRPDAGRIEVLGVNSRRLGPAQFQRLGYVSENQELPLWMSVRQLMDYCRPFYPDWDAAFAEKLRREFELPPEATLKHLSRGMRMKAALLVSLAYRLRLVVLDEPFSGLDPLVRDEFIRGLLELTEEEGWSVFVSSHDLEEVERLADQVAFIDRGRLRLNEAADALRARFRAVEVTLPAPDRAPANPPDHWLNPETAGRVFRFVHAQYTPERLREELARLLPGASAPEVSPLSLREVFLALARSWRLEGMTTTQPVTL